MAKGTLEGLKNWLGGEKTARPATAGAHDAQAEPLDPDAKGITPEDYDPGSVQGNNRTDAAAPGGPVNIPVKGGAPEAGPDAAREETPKATGRGSRDSTSQPQD